MRAAEETGDNPINELRKDTRNKLKILTRNDW